MLLTSGYAVENLNIAAQFRTRPEARASRRQFYRHLVGRQTCKDVHSVDLGEWQNRVI